jgi:hypothetical protein
MMKKSYVLEAGIQILKICAAKHSFLIAGLKTKMKKIKS